jgi:hypothetical protein
MMYSLSARRGVHGHLSAGNEHTGLILTHQQKFTVGEQLRRRLLRLIAKIPAEEMKNRVEFLGAWG